MERCESQVVCFVLLQTMFDNFSCFGNEIRVTYHLPIFRCRAAHVRLPSMGEKRKRRRSGRLLPVQKADNSFASYPKQTCGNRIVVQDFGKLLLAPRVPYFPSNDYTQIVSSVRHNCVCDFHFVAAVFSVGLLET